MFLMVLPRIFWNISQSGHKLGDTQRKMADVSPLPVQTGSATICDFQEQNYVNKVKVNIMP